jgi:hypothetical protein
MQLHHVRTIGVFVEVQRHGLKDVLPEFVPSLGLREDGVAECSGVVSAFLRANLEDDFRAIEYNYRLRARMGLKPLLLRFYVDPATGSPHIYNHQVTEDEVIDVLEKPGEDRAGREGSRIALGQTASGRFLRVVYVPDQSRTPSSSSRLTN